LFTDVNHQITNIFAPDVEVNTTLGPGGNFRYLSYPIRRHQLVRGRGLRRRKSREGGRRLPDRTHAQAMVVVRGRFYFEKDPTDDFSVSATIQQR